MTSDGVGKPEVPEVKEDDPFKRLELSWISLFFHYQFDKSWLWWFCSSYTTRRQMGHVSIWNSSEISCDTMILSDISITKPDASVHWSVPHHELALVNSNDFLMLVQVRAKQTSLHRNWTVRVGTSVFEALVKRVHGHPKLSDALFYIEFWFSFGFFLESPLRAPSFISCADLLMFSYCKCHFLKKIPKLHENFRKYCPSAFCLEKEEMEFVKTLLDNTNQMLLKPDGIQDRNRQGPPDYPEESTRGRIGP